MIVDRRWPWSAVLVLSACLLVLAIDLSSVPYGLDHLWQAAYATPASAFIAWRWSGSSRWLKFATGSLFVVCFTRAALFLIYQPDRAAGIAINVMVATFAVLAAQSQMGPR